MLQPLHRDLHFAQAGAHVARQRVGGAQRVEHGAFDAPSGIGLEAGAAALLEARERLVQADQARLLELVNPYVGRQT